MNIEQIVVRFQNILSTENIDSNEVTFNKNKSDYSIKYKNTVIFKVKPNVYDYVLIKSDYNEDIFSQYDSSTCVCKTLFTHVPTDLTNPFDTTFSALLLKIVRKILGLASYDEFGCCSKYMQCSDDKKCLYPDDPDYMGCHYKRNLEKGRIFYGKNKNA